MSVGWQTWAGQKAPITIDCPCNNNSGKPTRSTIVCETTQNHEHKLDNLATDKQQLPFANQVRLAKHELAEMPQRTPISTPTIDKLSRQTQACAASNVNKGTSHKNPQKPPLFKSKIVTILGQNRVLRSFITCQNFPWLLQTFECVGW